METSELQCNQNIQSVAEIYEIKNNVSPSIMYFMFERRNNV